MPDIFISYSRKDSEQAEQLAERLRSNGIEVWIDKSGIEAAKSWSKEIVRAIDECKAFLVLISSNSQESVNVSREVGIASESKKPMLPIALEDIKLSDELRYHLSGIQRVAFTQFDAITQALASYGITKAPLPRAGGAGGGRVDARKSLMILPFEDLSPTGDNQWFADGIVSELISALSNVKSLKISDNQATKEFKSYRGQITTYAREMQIRYFVQGDVRKFGDNIKIAYRLLDIETGDHLWQDSLKGTMEDIFDIQEKVAKKVLGGLAVILSPEEKKKVGKKPTENAEAYELYLKAIEYHYRHTKSDYERALALLEEALRLDSQFAAAYAGIFSTCQPLYRSYGRDEALLARAEAATAKVRELEGETVRYFAGLSSNALSRGDNEGALRSARRALEIDPAFAFGYECLGHAYILLGLREEAAEAWEEAVRLDENNRGIHSNLLIALNELGDVPEVKERLRKAAERAIPVFERHIRLNPDDYDARQKLATVFGYARRKSDALAEAEKLLALESLDGSTVYNLACMYLRYHQPERGMMLLRRTIEKGYWNIKDFRRDPDLAPLRDPASPFHAEFEELMKELEGAGA